MSTAPSNYRVVESRCPACNYKLDAATIADGEDRLPECGDTSVCLNCGQVLRYDPDLMLRKVTPQEIRELMEEAPDSWAVIEKAQRFIERRGRFA
jgi:hypothetical protein